MMLERLSYCLLASLSLVIGTTASSSIVAGEKFQSIFNGKDLKGWHARPEKTIKDWSVKNGVIVGIGSANRQSYLVFDDQKLSDFELKLQYRMVTHGNTGVEIRALPDKTGRRPFESYHADIGHVGIGDNILGAWDFHFATRREHPCPRGTKLIIQPDETRKSSKLKNAIQVNEIKKRDWNVLHIVAKGNHCEFSINGKVAAEFVDNAKIGYLKIGAIGLQLHDKGMHVEFKNIELKRLTNATQ